MRKPQEETIVWHPYPEEKPKHYRTYLVKWNGKIMRADFLRYTHRNWDAFYEEDSYFNITANVTEWTETPKGYQED